jgi:hypothetical protein
MSAGGPISSETWDSEDAALAKYVEFPGTSDDISTKPLSQSLSMMVLAATMLICTVFGVAYLVDCAFFGGDDMPSDERTWVEITFVVLACLLVMALTGVVVVKMRRSRDQTRFSVKLLQRLLPAPGRGRSLTGLSNTNDSDEVKIEAIAGQIALAGSTCSQRCRDLDFG